MMFQWTSTPVNKPITDITHNTSDKTISFNFMGSTSSNANLTSLTVNHGTLSPTFNSNTTNYTVNVENTVTTITITGKAEDTNATVTGNVTNAPLNVGNNNFTIKVTAQNGTTTKSYNVAVTRAAPPPPPQYTITASVEGNVGGAISPEGEITVEEGESVSFEMIADENYIIAYVLVDGDDVGTDDTYTFENVTEDHTIVVKFEAITAIEAPPSPPEGGDVRIYPNPTGGALRVTSYALQVTNVEIFDVFGRNVSRLTSYISHPISIDISSLPAGIYFIRIQTENGIVTRKVIKQ